MKSGKALGEGEAGASDDPSPTRDGEGYCKPRPDETRRGAREESFLANQAKQAAEAGLSQGSRTVWQTRDRQGVPKPPTRLRLLGSSGVV